MQCTPTQPARPSTNYCTYYDTANVTFDSEPTLAEMLALAQTNAQVRVAAKANAEQVERAAKAAAAEQAAAKAQADAERVATMTPLYHQIEAAAEAAIAGDRLEAIEAVYANWPQGLAYNFHPTGGTSLDHRLSERRSELKASAARAARTAWIAAHGSDYLKRATAAGHDCGRLYWIERAALEYPGYVLDYEKHHDSKSRSCPSLTALDERDAILAAHPGVKAIIEWLTAEPRDHRSEEWEPFENCEGIVVDDAAYDHYLVKLL